MGSPTTCESLLTPSPPFSKRHSDEVGYIPFEAKAANLSETQSDCNFHMCRACGEMSQPTPLTFTSNGFEFEECGVCRTVLATPEPTAEALRDAYRGLVTGDVAGWQGLHEGNDRDLDPYRRLLLTYASRKIHGRRLIEIGGGLGMFGKAAVRRGWDYTDYEPTEAAAVEASTELHVKTFEYGHLPPLSPSSADLVVMWEVLEHVWDVHDYLLAIREALSPGGLLMLSTPNFQRRGYLDSLIRPNPGAATSPPVHIVFFTRDSLIKVLRAAGFEPKLVLHRRLYGLGQKWATASRAIRILSGRQPPPTIYAVVTRD